METDSFALPIVRCGDDQSTYACPKHPRHVLPPLREHSLHDASVCNWRAVGLTKHCGKFTTTVVGLPENRQVCVSARAPLSGYGSEARLRGRLKERRSLRPETIGMLDVPRSAVSMDSSWQTNGSSISTNTMIVFGATSLMREYPRAIDSTMTTS